MGLEEHRKAAPKRVRVGVITISDTRTEDTDDSGRVIRDAVAGAGHTVSFYAVVKDDPAAIARAVEQAVQTCDAVITNGGTGLGTRDVTIETLEPRMAKRIPGFGELFRALSYEEIGAAAALSGATAGLVGGRLVFCLPGSPKAVRLAVDRLILPELGHTVGVVRR